MDGFRPRIEVIVETQKKKNKSGGGAVELRVEVIENT